MQKNTKIALGVGVVVLSLAGLLIGTGDFKGTFPPRGTFDRTSNQASRTGAGTQKGAGALPGLQGAAPASRSGFGGATQQQTPPPPPADPSQGLPDPAVSGSLLPYTGTGVNFTWADYTPNGPNHMFYTPGVALATGEQILARFKAWANSGSGQNAGLRSVTFQFLAGNQFVSASGFKLIKYTRDANNNFNSTDITSKVTFTKTDAPNPTDSTILVTWNDPAEKVIPNGQDYEYELVAQVQGQNPNSVMMKLQNINGADASGGYAIWSKTNPAAPRQ